jgi:hypothetical protein
MSANTGWNVSLNGKRIDKVFYVTGATADDIRRSLINHDGYDPAIKVTKEKARAPVWIKPRTTGRDPFSKQAFETNEINIFFADLNRIDKLPLADRKKNAQHFSEDLHRPGGLELIAERVGWLLNGTYGQGAQIKAMQVARSPRMNQAAYLVQTTAALEWMVPPKMTIAAWKTLSMAQRTKLDRLIKKEIKDELASY